MASDPLQSVSFTIPAPVIEETIDRALAGYSDEDVPVQRGWLRFNVKQSGERIRGAVKVEQEAVEASAATLRSVIRTQRAFRGRWGWLRLILSMLSLGAVFIGLHALFKLTWPTGYLDFHKTFGLKSQTQGALSLTLGGVALSLILVAIVVLRRLSFRPLVTDAAADLTTKLARRGEALRVQVQEVVRASINRYTTQEQSSGALLYETDSSGLVETTAPVIVGSELIADLGRFVREHDTSAIGIAGPRGCGKTTIIKQLKGLSGFLGVYIQAPVYYDAADFVRLVHAEIAREILQREDGSEVLLDRRALRAALLSRMITALGSIALGSFAIFLGQGTMSQLLRASILGTGGVVLIGIGVVSMVTTYVRFMSGANARSRVRYTGSAPVDLAVNELRTLRWKTSIEAKDKSSLKLLSLFTLDTEDHVGLDQRDRSHPERVGDLRDFLLKLRVLPRPPKVIVAIDELDKIASPEKAIEAVNGLKDLFHITDTHFVVSVSEDALDSFALRGVPVRDVFDSSFDTVMRIPPLTAADSWRLIGRRAPLFNEWAALLCHAVAGGLPRDLIRAARRCVDLGRGDQNPIPIALLAPRLVRDETLEVLDAAIRRTRSEGTASRWLMAARRMVEGGTTLTVPSLTSLFDTWQPVVSTSPAPLSTAVPAAVPVAAPTSSSAPAVGIEANVGVLLLIMATIADLFGVPRSSADWREFAAKSRDHVERLAATRAALAISHADALDRLCEVRALTGLTVIPPKYVDLLVKATSTQTQTPETAC